MERWAGGEEGIEWVEDLAPLFPGPLHKRGFLRGTGSLGDLGGWQEGAEELGLEDFVGEAAGTVGRACPEQGLGGQVEGGRFGNFLKAGPHRVQSEEGLQVSVFGGRLDAGKVSTGLVKSRAGILSKKEGGIEGGDRQHFVLQEEGSVPHREQSVHLVAQVRGDEEAPALGFVKGKESVPSQGRLSPSGLLIDLPQHDQVGAEVLVGKGGVQQEGGGATEGSPISCRVALLGGGKDDEAFRRQGGPVLEESFLDTGAGVCEDRALEVRAETEVEGLARITLDDPHFQGRHHHALHVTIPVGLGEEREGGPKGKRLLGQARGRVGAWAGSRRRGGERVWALDPGWGQGEGRLGPQGGGKRRAVPPPRTSAGVRHSGRDAVRRGAGDRFRKGDRRGEGQPALRQAEPNRWRAIR